MDVNATYAELRELSVKVLVLADSNMATHADDVERMAELFLALDGWITGPGGGYLPTAWEAK